ncbi:hypothetical protein [Streptomyces avermitilis]|uniref:hypothetical protein n=1 Tax=Streptomyces avermitilis TaxID=33903 RepID=UPI00368E8C02
MDLPVSELAEHMVRIGIPEPYATQRAEAMADQDNAFWGKATPTVEEITGRKPRSLANFLSDHATAFARQPI